MYATALLSPPKTMFPLASSSIIGILLSFILFYFFIWEITFTICFAHLYKMQNYLHFLTVLDGNRVRQLLKAQSDPTVNKWVAPPPRGGGGGVGGGNGVMFLFSS